MLRIAHALAQAPAQVDIEGLRRVAEAEPAYEPESVPITEEDVTEVAEAATSQMSADIVYRFLERRGLLGELEQEIRRREQHEGDEQDHMDS